MYLTLFAKKIILVISTTRPPFTRSSQYLTKTLTIIYLGTFLYRFPNQVLDRNVCIVIILSPLILTEL
jgi:hypothetical protein